MRHIELYGRTRVAEDVVTGRLLLDDRRRGGGRHLELLHLTGRHGTIERISRRNGADQNEHDEAHALLAVVGAVGERHARARGDERAPDPPGGRLIALRLAIEGRVADHKFQHQQQQRGSEKTEQRREQERVADLRRLAPVDARSAVLPVHQRVRDADPDDRTDERVRARCGQAEIPGAEIPDDRREQQREDHGEARAGADLQYQLDRQQRNDAERNRTAREDNSEEIEKTGPDHRNRRGHRMGIDHRGDGVGRVMETVDELEPERDQQRHE